MKGNKQLQVEGNTCKKWTFWDIVEGFYNLWSGRWKVSNKTPYRKSRSWDQVFYLPDHFARELGRQM